MSKEFEEMGEHPSEPDYETLRFQANFWREEVEKLETKFGKLLAAAQAYKHSLNAPFELKQLALNHLRDTAIEVDYEDWSWNRRDIVSLWDED